MKMVEEWTYGKHLDGLHGVDKMKTISYNLDKDEELDVLFDNPNSGEYQVEIDDDVYEEIFNEGKSPRLIDKKMIVDNNFSLLKIRSLKKKLAETDYMIIKGYEEQLEETDIIKDRREWRKEINELEDKL
jgi:hypothetical protein